MRNKLFAISLLLLCIALVSQEHPRRPRFNVIYSEQKELDGWSRGTALFEVIHDEETGQEVVCAATLDMRGGHSCWTTGRVWKGSNQ